MRKCHIARQRTRLEFQTSQHYILALHLRLQADCRIQRDLQVAPLDPMPAALSCLTLPPRFRFRPPPRGRTRSPAMLTPSGARSPSAQSQRPSTSTEPPAAHRPSRPSVPSCLGSTRRPSCPRFHPGATCRPQRRPAAARRVPRALHRSRTAAWRVTGTRATVRGLRVARAAVSPGSRPRCPARWNCRRTAPPFRS